MPCGSQAVPKHFTSREIAVVISFWYFHKHEIFDFCSEIIFITHFLLIFGVNTFKLMKSHLMTHRQTLRNIHRHLWGSLLQIYSMSQLNSEWLTSFTTMFTLYLYWKINCTFVLNLVNAFKRYSHWKFLLRSLLIWGDNLFFKKSPLNIGACMPTAFA